MKVYYIEHDGLWMTGYSIVVAKDEEEAKDIVVNKLNTSSLKPNIHSVKELNIKEKGIKEFYNGDY